MMKIILSLALFYYVQVFNLDGFEYSFENWTVRRIKKNEEFQGFEASVGKKKSFKVRLGLDRRLKYDDVTINLIIN